LNWARDFHQLLMSYDVFPKRRFCLRRERSTNMNAVLLGILFVMTCKDAAQSLEVSTLESQQTTIEVSQVSCDIPESINATCAMCVSKGGDCFWCERTKKCSNYRWYLPNCPLDEARYNNCWVNWKMLTITLSVLVGTIVTILCCVCCYCCYRCKRCRMRWVQRAVERRYANELANRLAMENRQQQRRMQRKAQLNSIREKYGIPPLEPTFQRIDDDSEEVKHRY
uniref:Pituitary tumor-transforming gene 1 protein-interacting protein n=1 Tax=Parascaris univalens TaxID=6257 RepID=A0A915AKH1_PARUN